jgi:hypothetical protein
MDEQRPESTEILAEFEGLLRELRARVEELRAGEAVDPDQLEQRLRELDELAGRAAATLESAKR